MTPAWTNRCFSVFAWGAGLLLAGAISVIFGFLCYNGLKTVDLSLIFGNVPVMEALLMKRPVFDGLFPAMAGTVILVVLSVFFALPIGLATGIFLAEYCPEKIQWFFNFLFDVLAGIPSIVVGLFGFCVTIFLHQYFDRRIFPCLLISALSLAFLVLPYIVRTTQISLENLPDKLRLTAPSLGATKLQNIFYVLLLSSLSGILSGVILAIGRCAEDTAVIMLTGAVAMAGVPKSLFSGFEALPFYIYYISSQYADAAELSKGYGACIILLFICITLFVLAHFIKNRLSDKLLYRP